MQIERQFSQTFRSPIGSEIVQREKSLMCKKKKERKKDLYNKALQF